MGIGPVFAVPKLLAKAGLRVEDIGLWELSKAFTVQVIYCRDRLGIPDARLNVDVAPSRWDIPTACQGRGWWATRLLRASDAAPNTW